MLCYAHCSRSLALIELFIR